MERMGLVGGEMVHMAGDDKETHLAFNISSQNMLGVRGSEGPRVGVQPTRPAHILGWWSVSTPRLPKIIGKSWKSMIFHSFSWIFNEKSWIFTIRFA